MHVRHPVRREGAEAGAARGRRETARGGAACGRCGGGGCERLRSTCRPAGRGGQACAEGAHRDFPRLPRRGTADRAPERLVPAVSLIGNCSLQRRQRQQRHLYKVSATALKCAARRRQHAPILSLSFRLSSPNASDRAY